MTWVFIDTVNGMLPNQHQAIIWPNAKLLPIGHLKANFNEVLIKLYTISIKENAFENIYKMSWP